MKHVTFNPIVEGISVPAYCPCRIRERYCAICNEENAMNICQPCKAALCGVCFVAHTDRHHS